MLANLGGLSSLAYIGEKLRIDNNGVLTNVDSLSSLASVSGGLQIYDNPKLTNVDGLSSLVSVGGLLNIYNNGMLTNIDGLSSLDSIGGDGEILNNPMLTNVDGLLSLDFVGGNFYIYSNNILTNVDGLSNLASVGGGLYIFNNPLLNTIQSFCGLYTLLSTSWNGTYSVTSNGINPTQLEIVALGAACPVMMGPQPSITGRDTAICIGDTIDLSTLVTGDVINTLEYGIMYGTYHPDSNMVSPLATTTYYVRDSSESTMLADTAKITVTVNLQPSIAGRDTTICAGESVDLSTLINGVAINTLEYGIVYGTYHPDSNMVSPLTSTNYFVIDSSAATTCSDTSQITITVLSPMECLMNFYSANELNFGDPCDCDQAILINNLYYFRDTLVIGAPTGLTIAFAAAGSSNIFDETGQPLANGISIPETPIGSGMYKIEFFKRNAVAAVCFVSVNGEMELVQIDPDALEVCNLAENCPELVPTMGQWGLVICGLLFFTLGVLGIKYRHLDVSIS